MNYYEMHTVFSRVVNDDLMKKVAIDEMDKKPFIEKMEELMIKNAETPVDQYQARLAFLQQKRDKLDQQAAFMFEEDDSEMAKAM